MPLKHDSKVSDTARYVNRQGAPLTRKQSQAQTREALLNAASELAVQQGLERASLAAIAERAGVTKGAIYANFASKEDLYCALIDRLAEGWQIGSWADAGDLKAMNSRDRDWCRLSVQLWSRATREGADARRLSDAYRSARATMADDLVEGGLDKVDAHRRAGLALALDLGLAMQRLLDPEAIEETHYADALRLLLTPTPR